MGWTLVQSKDSATGTCQFSSNTTTGNQIVVVNNAGTGATSVSISPGGGTFTKAIGISVSGIASEIWVCPNVTGGTTPTVTVSGGSGPGPTCYEFSGGTGTTDGTTSNTGNAALVSTTSITTTQAGDLVIKGFGVFGTPTGAPQSGWTEVNPTLNGNIAGYIVQSAAGAITGTDNQTGGTLNYCGVIAALKAASTGLSITPGGIASTNAFGTALIAPGAVNIAPTGIASTTAFGSATLSVGSVNIAPSAIASTNAFGNATLSGSYSISAAGIASTNAFGTPTLTFAFNISLTGIASTTVLGTAILTSAASISPTGIASTAGFGLASISFLVIYPPAIPSTTLFGNPTITVGPVGITPAGLPSTTVFGLPAVLVPPVGIEHNPVPPYTGDPQETEIDVPAWIAYKYIDWEEGPWVMPPYAWLYPPATTLETPPPARLQFAHVRIPVRRIRWVPGPAVHSEIQVQVAPPKLPTSKPYLPPQPTPRLFARALPPRYKIRWVPT